MKFILSILAVLAIVFLVGCSAKDTRDNKLSNSEITKLGKKYGGVYVFNKKFEKEIDDREKEREAVNRQILDEVSYISDKDERNKKMRKLLKERYYNNPKITQTLSNGKKYYTSTRSYEQDYKKAVNVSKKYINKIINFIGQEDYNKFKVKPRKNDVFMTRIGDIGTCAIVENDDDLAYYVTLTLIRPSNDIVLSKFLKYLIESSQGKKELSKRILHNATPIKINLGEVGKLQFFIPSIPVQEHIVSILDKFDALVNDISKGLPKEIELRQKQYEHYREKLLSFEK